MQSKAATVKQYLAELPADRRAAIQAVREVILKNLDKGYEEGMQYGAIGYYVPHRLFPDGYHCDPSKPLPFAGLGSQKNHMSLGLMCHYYNAVEDKWFRAAWAKTGKKLDMGVCCIRFKKLEDLPLDVIGEAFRRVPASKFIAQYESMLPPRSKKSAKSSTATGETAGKRASGKKRAGQAARKRRSTSSGKPSRSKS